MPSPDVAHGSLCTVCIERVSIACGIGTLIARVGTFPFPRASDKALSVAVCSECEYETRSLRMGGLCGSNQRAKGNLHIPGTDIAARLRSTEVAAKISLNGLYNLLGSMILAWAERRREEQ